MDLGENYVQEAVKKIEKMKSISDLKVRWHLIGALQTNKSKSVVGKFETIQSVDRWDLARALDKRAGEAGVVQNILLQVKLGDEPTKGGVDTKDVAGIVEAGRWGSEESASRRIDVASADRSGTGRLAKIFRTIARVARRLETLWFPRNAAVFPQLSMGTTDDFEIAVEEGATRMVRVKARRFLELEKSRAKSPSPVGRTKGTPRWP